MDVPLTDPPAVDALRSDLAGFTVDAVTQLLGPVAHAALGREQPVPALTVLAAVTAAGDVREPLATLVTAMVVGRPVRRRSLDAALPRLGADGAVRLGLVEAAGAGPDDEVRPLVDLRPYAAVDALGTADWWVASDLDELATGRPLRTDHVLGVGGASTTLARCALRRQVERVLDLGTGCGVQALHAGRHAGAVTGTDVSRRALAFARFNGALNGVPIETRHGDLFQPVAGVRFDQEVSNPPFVITPLRSGVPTYEYRDAVERTVEP
ncbi:MAG TPA: methyltransferase, partial [Kineosporiaceae bacterium]|nr:methyltransferase [Kineosporiaceae bacterium]